MRISEIACFTSNPDQTIDFYERLLDSKSPSKSREIAEFMLGETKLFIHKETSHASKGTGQQGGANLPFGDHIAFTVENLDELCQNLVSRGINVNIPPRSYYWGRSAYLKDPDGRWLELHEKSKL